MSRCAVFHQESTHGPPRKDSLQSSLSDTPKDVDDRNAGTVLVRGRDDFSKKACVASHVHGF